MFIMNLIQGFCMALADSVPGVSGGTIGFLLGFYDKFITSLNDLISGTKEERKEAVIFLAKILCGWVIGFCGAVLVLTSVFESHIYAISSLFMGFIIFAIPIVIKEEKDTLKCAKVWHYVFVLLGIALVSAITYFNPVSGEGISVEVSHLNVGLGIYVLIKEKVRVFRLVRVSNENENAKEIHGWCK